MTGNKISFLITKAEKKLLTNLLLLDPEFEGAVSRAREEDGKFRFEISAEDLDEGLNSLAACANHADSKQEEKKLDALFDKLSGYLRLSQNMNK